jgi:hypothetical protein
VSSFARVTALVALVALHCGKSAPPGATASSATASSGAGAQATGGAVDDAGPMDEREEQAWAQAADAGEPQELIRLTDLVGCETLRERASNASLRTTAVRAMAYCPDFSELPWLADVAAAGREDDAMAALDAIVDQAARPRHATDPDDADELHAGCGALLALARGAERPRARRVLAIRALRMLAERGCVARADIPTDLDAR